MTAFFISGPARSGKSFLYRSMAPFFNGDCVELDPVFTSLRKYVNPPQDSPLWNGFEIRENSFEDWLNRLIAMDEAWWSFLKDWIEDYHIYGKNFLTVGVVWPHLLTTLTVPHQAVFLVDTAEEHIDRALCMADETHYNNWMADWPRERIIAWANFNRKRAIFFKNEAEKYNYAVFDIGVHGYQEAQNLAKQELLKGNIPEA